MPDTEEQLFKLDGGSGRFNDIRNHTDLEKDHNPRNDLSSAFEDSQSSQAINPASAEQESSILAELDDGAISAERALVDDLLRQRIAKVNCVSADISRQLDALKSCPKQRPVTSPECL